MPQFEALQKKYRKSVELIGINIDVNDDIKDVEDIIEEFGLTMTMGVDEKGDLTEAFNVYGTPHYLLLDRDMNLIYQGYKMDESLTNKIELLSQIKPVDSIDADVLVKKAEDLELDLDDGKVHALFFTATWCDSYLRDSRPDYSRHCVAAQHNVNAVSGKYTDIVWYGVVSRLFTGDKALSDYRDRYAISYPVAIDKSNYLFRQFSVKDFPTLVLVKHGKMILKVTDLHDEEKLITLINNTL